MVSDQDIASCVESLLRHSDPAAAGASLSGVVRQIEAKLGLDLSHKASFIRDQIDLLLGPQHPSQAQAQAHRQPQLQLRPPPPASASAHPNPYTLHQHHHQQILAPPMSSSSGGLASAFPHQHHPDLAFGYPPAPPLPAAAVVAAYHLQQQLQQPPYAASAAVRPVSGSSSKEGVSTGIKRRGGPGGLSKVCGVSPELQPIVGEAEMPRTQIVKQLWAYIRKNNLQDPNNKRKIICNDELRRVFESDSTDMFKMNKLLAKHIISLEHSMKDKAQEAKKLRSTDLIDATEVTEPGAGECHVVISEALTKFFGSEVREMLQTEPLDQLWKYIKVNQLEDSGSASILCDSKLQELFGCESLPASRLSDMVAKHLFKKS